VADIGESAAEAVLRSDAANGDMNGLAGEQHLGATNNVLKRAVLLQLADFVRRILLGHAGRSSLLAPEGSG